MRITARSLTLAVQLEVGASQSQITKLRRMLMRRVHVLKYLLPVADRQYIHRCLCYHGSRPLGDVRAHFRHFLGGSVDLTKDEHTGIATIVMNNPSRKNAFTGKMMVDFDDCITELEDWKLGKAVIMAGAGGTFCSGGDLNTVRQTLSNGMEMSQLMQSASSRLFNLPMISVAVIDGHALGGGAELTTACDFRIMKSKAKIGFVQVKLNVATGWGGCTRLVELLGRTKALQLLASGRVMNAESAHRLGFVEDILEDNGDAVELGIDWMKEHCIGSTAVTRVIKQMVLAGVKFDEQESLVRERELFLQVWGNKFHQEALSVNKKHK